VVVTTLLDRLFDSAERYGAQSVGIAGGVSANARLRDDLAERSRRVGIPSYVPAIALSTDNAAMIAAAGLRNFRAGKRAGMDLNADASLELT
jgi:N6-L-threonylcarbamoyladenine synthase